MKILLTALGLMISGAAMPAHAALTITQNANIAAGQAGFGPSLTVFDWDTYPAGSFGTAAGAINITNWLNGPGFDEGGPAARDLAINGVENVTWTFAAPLYRVGFAISTGLESVFTNQIDHTGAVFNLTASNGDAGTLTLVDSGSGYAAWVEVSSATPFISLSFVEPSGNIWDQYWGDVVGANTAAVPEPTTWAMLLLGLGAVGFAMRRKPDAVRVNI